jgi:solute carrier family 25 (mitochondrial uncoupling protein), member 27
MAQSPNGETLETHTEQETEQELLYKTNKRTAVTAERNSLPLKYVLSAFSASVAETLTYPTDIIKTRLQIQGEVASNVTATTTSTSASIPKRGSIATLTGIVREEGALALYDGLPPALLRHVVYSGVRMVIYEYLRNNVLQPEADGSLPIWKAATAGMICGAVGQFLASPADLVKVRLQLDGKRKLQGLAPRYKGTVDAFGAILRKEGLFGFWRGVAPNCQRAALVNLGDLTAYDTTKRLMLRYTTVGDTMITHALASAMSSLAASVFGTPADVIKTRVMNQPTINGKGKYYSSSWDCAVKTVRQEGFRALYKGFIPIWVRMAPWSMSFWLTYEKTRELVGASSF